MGMIEDLLKFLLGIIAPSFNKSLEQKIQGQSSAMLYYGNKIGIRSCNGTYIMCDLDSGERLFGRKRKIDEWEIFEIVNPKVPFVTIPNRLVRYGDKVGFRSINNKNFIGANLNSNEKEVMSIMPKPDTWETFTLVSPPVESKNKKGVCLGGAFALKAYNNRFVRFKKDGDGGLYADAEHIKDWEIFYVINPSDAK